MKRLEGKQTSRLVVRITFAEVLINRRPDGFEALRAEETPRRLRARTHGNLALIEGQRPECFRFLPSATDPHLDREPKVFSSSDTLFTRSLSHLRLFPTLRKHYLLQVAPNKRTCLIWISSFRHIKELDDFYNVCQNNIHQNTNNELELVLYVIPDILSSKSSVRNRNSDNVVYSSTISTYSIQFISEHKNAIGR